MRINAAVKEAVYTHEGARAQKVTPYLELRRTLLTCLLWEDTFYEKGSDIAKRLSELVAQVGPKKVASLAVEAREKMYLRHAPLFIVRELARQKGKGSLVSDTLERIIQRADELAEYVSIYWKDGRKPLSAGSKRGLAKAFTKFSPYALAKYNRDNPVKLRDVLFLCHAKPKTQEQGEVWKGLVDGTLESPDTWEVALSSGKDKKETWERLLSENKLGGLALLRNLRNMQQVRVEDSAIRASLDKNPFEKVLPFRFIAAARYAPDFSDTLEKALFRAAATLDKLESKTAIVVDNSVSMHGPKISSKSEIDRADAACALAAMVREVCPRAVVIGFGSEAKKLAAHYRGFSLIEAIRSGPGGGTNTQTAVSMAAQEGYDRIIVITDEQSHQAVNNPLVGTKAYMINVAVYKNGVGYGNGWCHIDGWSERVLDFIRVSENEQSS